jgi:hypothetical protein
MLPETAPTCDDPRVAFVNQLEIRQIGMSRSGNHALANWILRQSSGRACFLNCAEPRTNPWLSARPLDDGSVVRANYSEFDLAGEQQGNFSRKDLLLFSHEDCFLGPLSTGGPFETHHDRWLGPSRRRVDVLLLRDPFNLFASRINGAVSHAASQTAFRIWKQHAREYLGLRRHLGKDRVLVSYNRWVRDVRYRAEVAHALELPFTDAGRLQVPGAGLGSSFDGRRFDGNAEKMAVLDRWRWLEQHPRHLEGFDADVLELAVRIFGEVCEEPFYRLLERLRN